MPDTTDKIKQQFDAAFGAAKRNREKTKLSGLSWEGFWKYWYEMGFNPYQHGWNVKELRKDGKLGRPAESIRFRTGVNLINDQLQDMVSRETANPIKPKIYATDKVYEDIPSGEVALGESSMQALVYPSYQKDALINLAERVMNAVTANMNLEDRREDLCLGRRVWGFMGMGMNWLPGKGDKLPVLSVKNGEQWDIVTGQWSKDGGIVKVRKPESDPSAPEFDEYGEGAWKEEAISSGGPELEGFFPWQLYWNGRTTSHSEALGVFIVDYLTKSEAQEIYGSTGNVNGKEVPIVWEKLSADTVPDGDDAPIHFWEFSPATQVYERVRYRRRPQQNETRSQWITRLAGEIVEAKPCPYGKSFDKSLGTYVFFDRKIPGMIEAMSTVGMMSPNNTLFNLLFSADVENADQMPIGKFKQVGGGDDSRINYSKQSGVSMVTSDLPFEELRAPETPQTILRLQAFMMQMVQQSSTTQDIVQGMREQDAPTLGQAQLQKDQNTGKLGLNLRRDAREWTKFYRDVLTLVCDERLNTTGLALKIVEEKGKTGYREFAAPVAFFKTIKDIEVGPKNLEDNTNEEINKILFVMGRMPQVVPGAPDPFAKTRLGLMTRLMELLDIPNVPPPDAPAMLEAGQTGALEPSADPALAPGETIPMTLPPA